MKSRSLLPAAFALLFLSCAHDRPRPTQPGRIDVENLKSVPYASWTKGKDDTQLTGVTKYDRRRTNPGYNVFTDDKDRAFLMDNEGRVVHQWRFEGARQCEFVRVLPNGDAIGECVNQGVRKVDKNSRTVWFYRGPVSHDLEILPDGRMIVPEFGGAAKYKGRSVTIENLTFLSSEGVKLSTWSTWTPQGPRFPKLHPPSPLEEIGHKKGQLYDYFKLNSVQSLPKTPLGEYDRRFAEGNLLISCRNLSLVVVLDKDEMKPVWSWGPKEIDGQHTPLMLPSGNMLVFDNRLHGKESRVIEIEPVTHKTVWEYPGKGDPKFYTKFRGNAQRLPNGNTLICDSENGHAFEVTAKGDIVWEFWSPFFNKASQRRRIYRMNRVDLDPSAFAAGAPVDIKKIPPPR